MHECMEGIGTIQNTVNVLNFKFQTLFFCLNKMLVTRAESPKMLV